MKAPRASYAGWSTIPRIDVYKRQTLPRADIVRKSLADWSAVVLVPDMDAAIAIANRVAPEHLEVLMREPWSVLPRIRHAGAVFLGPYAPEPLGDYFAGPNHVLPTLGTARFSSALSVPVSYTHLDVYKRQRSCLA